MTSTSKSSIGRDVKSNGVSHALDVRVPEHWLVVPLENILDDIIGGGTPSRSNLAYWEGEIPWLTVKDMRGQRPEDSIDHISEEAVTDSATNIIPADTVIIATRIGLGKVIRVSYPAAINQDLKALIAKPGIDKGYLEYWIVSIAEYLQSIGSGTTVKGIRLEQLRSLPFPLAPEGEQKRIVAEIEKQFSRLDEAVANIKRVKANLKRYKAAVLKAAVEGTLVPTEARIAQSEGRPYESAGHLIARTEVPSRPNRYTTRSKDIIPGHAALAVGNPGSPLPVGWAWSPLVEIARMETGHTPSREHPEWWDGDIPWIGIADAREHHGQVINETVQHTNEGGLENSAARLLPTGTVCVSRTASVGYVVVMGRSMATSQDFVNWVPTQAVTSDWLRIIFLADRDALIRFGKGSVHKTIYFPEWLSVHVGVPPRVEQDRIAAEVDRRLSAISAIESAVSNNMKRAEHLRQSILRDAFLGRLVSGEPTDEPASILFERIRIEEATKSLLPRGSVYPKRKRRTEVMGEKEKRSLLEALRQHPSGITPEALLSASNYSIDEVDAFYSELSKLYEDLEETKPEGNALFAWPYDAKVTLRLKAK